jgi:rubrerythrin
VHTSHEDFGAAELGRTAEAHAAAEEESIKLYRELAETGPDPVIRQLMRFILEDEEHHHAALRRIATMLNDDPTLGHPYVGDRIPPEEQTRMAAALEQASRDEYDGAQQLRALALQTSGLAEGLIPLALEVMARDSEKHALLLRFAVERLRHSEQKGFSGSTQ